MRNFLKFKKFNQQNSGFTLIELLVSLAILSMGLAASLTLITQSLKASGYLKNQMIASYLAVEGIELVKNIRDGNLLDAGGGNWLSGINNCGSVNGCYIDGLDGDAKTCNASGCPNLNYDDKDALSLNYNRYNYDTQNGTNKQTIFKRTIKLTDTIYENLPGKNDEREVLSEVKWTDRFGPHTYTLKTHIFNYKIK